jgi:hypothetical protein
MNSLKYKASNPCLNGGAPIAIGPIRYKYQINKPYELPKINSTIKKFLCMWVIF